MIFTPVVTFVPSMHHGLRDNLALIDMIEKSIESGTYDQARNRTRALLAGAIVRNTGYECSYERTLIDYPISATEDLTALDLCTQLREEIESVLSLYEGNRPLPVKDLERGLSRVATISDALDSLAVHEMTERFIPMFESMNTDKWQNNPEDENDDEDDDEE